jgi:hypothetical protein
MHLDWCCFRSSFMVSRPSHQKLWKAFKTASVLVLFQMKSTLFSHRSTFRILAEFYIFSSTLNFDWQYLISKSLNSQDKSHTDGKIINNNNHERWKLRIQFHFLLMYLCIERPDSFNSSAFVIQKIQGRCTKHCVKRGTWFLYCVCCIKRKGLYNEKCFSSCPIRLPTSRSNTKPTEPK